MCVQHYRAVIFRIHRNRQPRRRVSSNPKAVAVAAAAVVVRNKPVVALPPLVAVRQVR